MYVYDLCGCVCFRGFQRSLFLSTTTRAIVLSFYRWPSIKFHHWCKRERNIYIYIFRSFLLLWRHLIVAKMIECVVFCRLRLSQKYSRMKQKYDMSLLVARFLFFFFLLLEVSATTPRIEVFLSHFPIVRFILARLALGTLRWHAPHSTILRLLHTTLHYTLPLMHRRMRAVIFDVDCKCRSSTATGSPE